MVNGRPIIKWVIQNILKKTNDTVIIIDEKEKVKEFIDEHYPKNSRVKCCVIKQSNDAKIVISREIEKLSKETIRLIRNDLVINNDKFDEIDSISIYNNVICRIQGKASTINSMLNENRLTEFTDTFDSKFQRIFVEEGDMINFSDPNGMEEAKLKLIESRSFNSLRINRLYPEIIKSSSNKEKLQNEVFWYRELPSRFKSLTPQVFGHSEEGIRMEYYGYGTLTEKFLYGNLPLDKWRSIIQKMLDIVNAFSLVSFKADNGIFHIFYGSKLKRRLEVIRENNELKDLIHQEELYINNIKYNGLPVLLSKIMKYIEYIANSAVSTVCHGDMCFNNILYDLPTGIVKLIDPRGNIEGIPSIICDPRYDIAKLRHSFCGNYDGIVEGDYYIKRIKDNSYEFETAKDLSLREREALFDDLCIKNGFEINEIRFIEAYLFLTMIPLHTDSRNKIKAFFLLSIIKFNKAFKRIDHENLH